MSEYGFLPRKKSFGTRSVHGGEDPEQWTNWDLVSPVCLSVTYKQESAGRPHNGWTYSRNGNPSRSALESALASLEEADHSLTFSSGMAAVVSLTHLLSAGDHILLVDEVYGGTSRYFLDIAARMNISTTFVDGADLDAIRNEIKTTTKMIWLESPSNPLLKIIDLKLISKFIHEQHPGILVTVDNTFMTPYFQTPLALGADICMSSLTKYVNGHSDVTMGAVSVKSEELYEKLHYLQYALGTIPSPFDCYHVLRSLKTLPLRMEKHMANGIKIAKYLESHEHVARVFHPVLKSHPQFELARRQSHGHSGMIAFYLKGGESESRTFLESVRVFRLATSLGNVGSLVAMPLVMLDVPEHQKKDKSIINHSLMRMSVGLEDHEDLIEDLKQALNKAFG